MRQAVQTSAWETSSLGRLGLSSFDILKGQQTEDLATKTVSGVGNWEAGWHVRLKRGLLTGDRISVAHWSWHEGMLP